MEALFADLMAAFSAAFLTGSVASFSTPSHLQIAANISLSLASCILRPDPSLHPERRSPGEAGLNVHAYDATGKIFPNATAFEMVNADMFQLGTVGKTAFEDVLNHPTLKTLTMASVYDCLPGFSEHWATPFLSLDPLACYAQTGNLFETLPTSSRAKVALGQLETLFAILIEGNQEKSDRLDQWISV